MPDVTMSGGPLPHEVAAILVALRVTARPGAVPDPARRRPVVLAHVTSGRAWRLAPAAAV